MSNYEPQFPLVSRVKDTYFKGLAPAVHVPERIADARSTVCMYVLPYVLLASGSETLLARGGWVIDLEPSIGFPSCLGLLASW